MHTELPEPSPEALAHSHRLVALLHERIVDAGGWLSFRDYMKAALYEPGLGYYSAGATKFGAAGDFVTAPELSPLFSQCLASQIAAVLAQLDDVDGNGDVLELGAGSGRMAADMLSEFAALDALPDRYLILEPSADLRERQQRTLSALPTTLRERVRWLDALPAEPLRGVIVGNEVVDALPVQRFVMDDGAVGEVGVSSEDGTLSLTARPADAALRDHVAQLGVTAQSDYVSEVRRELAPWLEGLADSLAAGAIMFLDYGYSRREYYLPERSTGTLRCYYRHRAHDDALLWPGLQDITAWVDFTALAEAATAVGLDVAGYTTQAQFLLSSGIDQRADAVLGGSLDGEIEPQAQVSVARALRQLMLPGEMGETVKVMLLARGVSAPAGFGGRDMRSSL
ncbi:MAG: SAM-dependent methyltransferase [Gammaproteobacteria bacterium]|nr:SAM-dependent methyltransferase [Gammaproteobacteria bacterium]NND54312.1 SAM-dependent methyltransferase [Gammaproteobacteria bacterium]